MRGKRASAPTPQKRSLYHIDLLSRRDENSEGDTPKNEAKGIKKRTVEEREKDGENSSSLPMSTGALSLNSSRTHQFKAREKRRKRERATESAKE